MLKEFRSIDVYWDKATRRIYEEIRSSSSDEKGRKLTVQIVNDGQIQDLTNVALNLYWETQDGENRGLDPFEPLDAENGIYELYFRTGMLEHVGKLNAHLHLVDTTGAITSEPFTISVFKGVDVDAMASDDELSALNQALIEVQNIKQDEAERVSAETERIAAEEERVSNENERKTAETARATAENTRNTNETDRVNAEDTRNTNETNRVDAETARVIAETARVTAEEEREEGYPLLDGRLAAVEQDIIDIAREAGYATQLLIVTDDFTANNLVSNMYAYRLGRIAYLKFDVQPTSTGITSIITTNKHRPITGVSIPVVPAGTYTTDSNRGISARLLYSGEVEVIVPTNSNVPASWMTASVMYLVRGEDA